MPINAEVEEVTEESAEESATEEAAPEAKPARKPRASKAKGKAAPSTEVAVLPDLTPEPAVVDGPEPLSERAAKALDKKIRTANNGFHTSREKLLDLLNEAAEGQIHVALGLPSWTAWISEAVTIHADDKKDRKALVLAMSERKMSQRQIAAVLGISQKTVDRDLDGANTGDTSIGSDGKEHTRTKKERDEEIIDAEVVSVDEEPVADADTESEEYEPTEPVVRSAVELLENFADEVANLFNAHQELAEIMAEEKWPNARRRAGKSHQNTIADVAKNLQDIIDDLMTVTEK